ncbi:MAG TPA: hypothetical protein VNN73_10610 [Blastocatellia bacterium]|jgi:hypothetical protein|nr:hypothetical protein [Blastocatellia bacterium]
MKTQRFALALALLNLMLLIFLVTQNRKAEAQGVAPVLRGRELEIVDDQGRVRASIKIHPADPKVKMPDGTTGYPETVILRLINSKGGPNVKLATTEDGSGLVLGGESGPTYVQILARGANPFLKLINKEGREQVIKP